MPRPFLRVTKWLNEIPVEAQCRACPETNFRATSTNPRPTREEYAQSLQRQFEAHMKSAHPPESLNEPG